MKYILTLLLSSLFFIKNIDKADALEAVLSDLKSSKVINENDKNILKSKFQEGLSTQNRKFFFEDVLEINRMRLVSLISKKLKNIPQKQELDLENILQSDELNLIISDLENLTQSDKSYTLSIPNTFGSLWTVIKLKKDNSISKTQNNILESFLKHSLINDEEKKYIVDILEKEEPHFINRLFIECSKL